MSGFAMNAAVIEAILPAKRPIARLTTESQSCIRGAEAIIDEVYRLHHRIVEVFLSLKLDVLYSEDLAITDLQKTEAGFDISTNDVGKMNAAVVVQKHEPDVLLHALVDDP